MLCPDIFQGTITGPPAVFGRKDSAGNFELPALVVAGTIGGVYTDEAEGGFGTFIPVHNNIDDEGGIPHIWAPGFENSVPKGNSLKWKEGYNMGNYKNTSGTSNCKYCFT